MTETTDETDQFSTVDETPPEARPIHCVPWEGTLTVGALIEALQKLPPDMAVAYQSDYLVHPVTNAFIQDGAFKQRALLFEKTYRLRRDLPKDGAPAEHVYTETPGKEGIVIIW